MQRREVIRYGGVAASALLAGCSGGSTEPGNTEPGNSPTDESTDATRNDPETSTPETDTPTARDVESLSGSVRPDGDPPTVPARFDCRDGVTRLEQKFSESALAWGAYPADDPTYALRVSDLEPAYGDTVTITHALVADESASAGPVRNVNLQVRTDEGWVEVRGWEDEAVPFPAFQEQNSPGWTFEREIRVSTSGIDELSANHGTLGACAELPAGRYRYVWWGMGDDAGVIGVAFDLTK